MFERIADESPDLVRLVSWSDDGSAILEVGDVRFRMSPPRVVGEDEEGEPVELVRVARVDGDGEEDGVHVFVSPVPSAILAVALR